MIMMDVMKVPEYAVDVASIPDDFTRPRGSQELE